MNITTLNMTTLDGNVIIKKGGGGTPAPPSGGESASTLEYLDVSGLGDEEKVAICSVGYLAKGEGVVLPIGLWVMEGLGSIYEKLSPITAVSVDWNAQVLNGLTIKDIVENVNTDSIPRLTKEQFYSLD